MNLIEIKILYNADHQWDNDIAITTKEHIMELLYWLDHRPDVIHISKTIIAEGGGDDSER